MSSGDRTPRSEDKVVEDLLDAATAAAELVNRGRETWDADRLLRPAHVYHRIDYAVVGATLVQDVPRLAHGLGRWQELHRGPDREADRGDDFDIGF